MASTTRTCIEHTILQSSLSPTVARGGPCIVDGSCMELQRSSRWLSWKTALFALLEKWGKTLVHTKFGTEGECPKEDSFLEECDLIIGKGLEGYVRSEYGNLWETHQCRTHAYGHTCRPRLRVALWHAVATCMGFGAYLALWEGFIAEEEMKRILKLISDCELTLYHPVMDDSPAGLKSAPRHGGEARRQLVCPSAKAPGQMWLYQRPDQGADECATGGKQGAVCTSRTTRLQI